MNTPQPKVRDTDRTIDTVTGERLTFAIDNDLIRYMLTKENTDAIPADPQPA